MQRPAGQQHISPKSVGDAARELHASTNAAGSTVVVPGQDRVGAFTVIQGSVELSVLTVTLHEADEGAAGLHGVAPLSIPRLCVTVGGHVVGHLVVLNRGDAVACAQERVAELDADPAGREVSPVTMTDIQGAIQVRNR
jgi:hypothetical protein